MFSLGALLCPSSGMTLVTIFFLSDALLLSFLVLPLSVLCIINSIPRHFLQFQGDEKLDTDIPTSLEARLFCTTFGKMIWMSLQPLFYALRPVVTYPKTPTFLEIFNTTVQLTFNFLVCYYFGGMLSCIYFAQ